MYGGFDKLIQELEHMWFKVNNYLIGIWPNQHVKK